jgi:hypothetical protein
MTTMGLAVLALPVAEVVQLDGSYGFESQSSMRIDRRAIGFQTGSRNNMPEQIAKGTVVLGENFMRHRIKGYVPHGARRGLDPNLDVPLITNVEGGLWQGGCMDDVSLPHEFDFVLSLYPWEQYRLGPDTIREEVEMYDSLDQATDQIDRLARGIVERLRKGQTCLIHCQAGLNRSGLVTARVLTLLGKTPIEALETVRRRSPLVLCNEAFENAILAC